jgi:hypothetical protein
MLTKEQIEAVRRYAHIKEHILLNDVDVASALVELAAVYERVAAWVESGALDAVIRSRHLSPEVREAVQGCRDEVRREPEG